MELERVLRDRRSIRKFTGRPVPQDLLDSLLRKALWAPSGMNRQPWKFVVLRGSALQKLLALSSGLAESMDEPLKAQKFNDKMRSFIIGYFKNLGGAGSVVAGLSRHEESAAEDYANVLSAAAAFYNFLLLAHEAGLATCWMTGYVSVEKQLLNLMGVQGHRLVGITPVGYPDQAPPVPPRKHEDLVWLE
ncbi:MAG: nitroreductase family protein [Desulfovibrio sp.]|jgi:nitroreductase|nr:nitroreductase family protein [Desulfovibrio sp.]